jgi:hypothetical protein
VDYECVGFFLQIVVVMGLLVVMGLFFLLVVMGLFSPLVMGLFLMVTG